jgi:hypothetical protein
MGTLKGFPNPPALWLRRAKLGFAYAFVHEPGQRYDLVSSKAALMA